MTRQRPVKIGLWVPCRKTRRAHFSALIPLAAGTDFHYGDIINLSTHMAKKKKICAETRLLFISPLAHAAASRHRNLVTFCGGKLWTETAVIVIYSIFGEAGEAEGV